LGLAGLKKADLERGDVLAFPESLMATTRIDVELTALQGTRFPVANNMRVHLFHGAREILARVILLDTDIVDPGATVHAQLRLEEEAYVKYGDRFVIRFYSPLETIGGGVIVDPLPAKRRRRRPINEPEFRIMASENKAERLALAILQGEHQLAPITMACYRAGITAEDRNALIRQLISDETIVMLNDRVAIHRKTLERLGEDATDILERFHRERSLESGMRREELRTRLLPRADIQLSDLVIDQLERAGYLNIAAGLVAKAGFKVTLSDAEKEVIEEIEALFAVAGFTPPGTDELFEKFNKRANAEQIITLLLNKGTLVRLTPQILMPKQLVDEAWNVVRTTIESEGQITLGDFRDKIKATRKFAIALLEFFDRQKKTKLVGDARVFN
jgi:selenocysteine-specific elongation factor